MNIKIPEYIEGELDAQYKGDFESKGIFQKDAIKSGSKYSVVLYKDLRIKNTEIISEDIFLSTKDNEEWWKIDHTAEAAIEFLKPFYGHFSFLRHKPIEIFVKHPQIAFQDKRNSGITTYGKIHGKIRARLTQPEKKEVTPVLKKVEPLIEPTVTVEPEPVIVEQPVRSCFESRGTSCFGLNEGPLRTGGCYGLSGGSLGPRGCFGNYGNPNGCFNVNKSSGCFPSYSTPGCFPNFSFGCLIPLLFLLALLFSLFKSCDYIKSISPIVNTIKKDRDDSRKPPPEWVRNENPDSVFSEKEIINPGDTTIDLYDSIAKKQGKNASKRDSIIQNEIQKGEVAFMLWDWDVEDKDSISLYLNNQIIADNIRLRKKPIIIKKKGLRYGENYLVIKAMNRQLGVNTAAIKGFSDRSIVCDTHLVQSKSQISRLTLIYR